MKNDSRGSQRDTTNRGNSLERKGETLRAVRYRNSLTNRRSGAVSLLWYESV